MLVSDLVQEPDEEMIWLCHPYVARHGITLVHGKKSLGKSPFSWALSQAVGTGGTFLGQQCSLGRVLYLEKDTSKHLLKGRLRRLPLPFGDWHMEFLLDRTINLADVKHPSHSYLRGLNEQYKPDFVVWNPLSKLYVGNEGDVVPRVYDAMAHIFPNAGHLLLSHDRKADRAADSRTIDSEEHSGRQEWVNLAANVYRLKHNGHHLTLAHTGSQIVPLGPDLDVELTNENSSIQIYSRIQDVGRLVQQAPGNTKAERVLAVAQMLGKGKSTIYRALAEETAENLAS